MRGQFVKGHAVPKEWIEKGNEKRIGRKASVETKEKMKLAQIERYRKFGIPKEIYRKHSAERNMKNRLCHLGEKNGNWKGGKSSEAHRLRSSMMWRNWRKQVFERDDYTCQKCKVRGGILHPHHIENVARCEENKRFSVDNGVTLCEDHHRDFHKEYGNKNNIEQLDKFLTKSNLKGGELNGSSIGATRLVIAGM